MAKANNKDLKDLEQTPTETPKKKTGKTTVKFTEIIRADYGSFDPGDVAELDESIANTLLKYGYCEIFKGEAKKEIVEEY